MRFCLAVLAAVIAATSPAYSAIVPCNFFPDGAASCDALAPALIPGAKEVHLAQGGTYKASLIFDAPLAFPVDIEIYTEAHFDVYDAAGNLTFGNAGGAGYQLLFETLSAGITKASFVYSVPDFLVVTPSQYAAPPDNGVMDVFGVAGGFTLNTYGPPPPRFTLDVTKITSVPEPESWFMMVAGFGMIGGLIRRLQKSHAAQTMA